ncbi:MAPEG family protein [Microbulbifer sp. CAU 1566]|uniref:MAPEG family protein n=1 Tax=unclassified Microbulbifer TaxID=2619833 RepID=UPI00135959CB|nr:MULTISPECIES: MAPEG family protein [unclassified Microbulbifer]MCK7597048.1 MAPEG family protein [Microbulbifer sp. CAU 1566]
MSVEITALYGSLCALLVIALAFKVVTFRRGKKVGIGTAGDKEGEVAVRAHANAIEYIPLALILLLVAEINGLSHVWLHVLGASLVLGRLLHAVGFTVGKGGYHPGRFVGTLLTWIVILALAVINLLWLF